MFCLVSEAWIVFSKLHSQIDTRLKREIDSSVSNMLRYFNTISRAGLHDSGTFNIDYKEEKNEGPKLHSCGIYKLKNIDFEWLGVLV